MVVSFIFETFFLKNSIDHAQFTRPLLNGACVDSNPYVRKAVVFSCLLIARDSSTSKENRGFEYWQSKCLIF